MLTACSMRAGQKMQTPTAACTAIQATIVQVSARLSHVNSIRGLALGSTPVRASRAPQTVLPCQLRVCAQQTCASASPAPRAWQTATARCARRARSSRATSRTSRRTRPSTAQRAPRSFSAWESAAKRRSRAASYVRRTSTATRRGLRVARHARTTPRAPPVATRVCSAAATPPSLVRMATSLPRVLPTHSATAS